MKLIKASKIIHRKIYNDKHLKRGRIDPSVFIVLILFRKFQSEN